VGGGGEGVVGWIIDRWGRNIDKEDYIPVYKGVLIEREGYIVPVR
jgi:hypothetical protein